MDELAHESDEDRRAVFGVAADEKQIRADIIEKDFWVCWTLRRLFAPSLVPGMVFKGGTSLSKGWGAIRRFSEDIDLTVPRSGLPTLAVFAHGGECDPLSSGLTRRKRKGRVNALGEAFNTWCTEQGRDEIARRISGALGTTERWSVVVDPDEPERIRFHYPATIQGNASVEQAVRMEFGAKMPTEPTERRAVKPYCATAGGYVMRDAATEVPMLDARRTFWEKATMLHERNSATAEQLQPGLSRQYADVAVLWRGAIGKEALEDLDLLRKVAEEKEALYYTGRANYPAAGAGNLRLVPPPAHEKGLRSEYRNTEELYFGDRLGFDEIMQTLQEIEKQVRARTVTVRP